MANYPIKMLKDEQSIPFVPLVSTMAVRNPDGQTVEDILASKLSPENVVAGDNIIVTQDGNDVVITADVPDTTVLVDNLSQTTAGVGALDARQGNVLLNKFSDYYTQNEIDAKVASANDLGMIKVGAGLSIDANGVLSAQGGGGGGDTDPIGVMKLWPASTAPEGYLICDGTTYNKIDYPVLYDNLDSAYIIDTDTFRVPDMRGRVAIGAGSFDGINTFTLSTTGGNYNCTLLEANLPAHTHTFTATTDGAGKHTHTGTTDAGGKHSHTASSNEVANHTHTGTTDGGGKHNHGGSTGNAGKHNHGGSVTGGGHNHNAYFKEARQTNSYNFSNDFARGQSSGGDYNKQITTSDGSHSHTITEQANHSHTITEQANHTHTFTTGGAGKHSHTITVNDSSTHTHTFTTSEQANHTHSVSGTTDSTGSGTAFSLLQPYLVINYIIKAEQTTPIQAMVQDTLNSSSSTNALSARCGKVLDEKIDDLIVTEDVTVDNISLASGATTYATFTIPSKTGYTPISISTVERHGGGSGFMVFAPSLDGYVTIYNGWGSDFSGASIVFRIVYLKSN